MKQLGLCTAPDLRRPIVNFYYNRTIWMEKKNHYINYYNFYNYVLSIMQQKSNIYYKYYGR